MATRAPRSTRPVSRRARPAPQRVVPSEALAPVLGEGPLPRREVLPRLWRYIRAHGLQVEVDRRVVETDAVLRRAFGGRAQVSMFELLGLVSRHLTPWEGEGPG